MGFGGAFLFFLVAIFCVPSLAVAQTCPPAIEAQVTLTPLTVRPSLDFSLSMAELKAKAGVQDKDKESGAAHEEIPVGLSEAHFTLDAAYNVRAVRKAGEGTLCAQIDSFELRFGFEAATIFIASEFPEGACGHDAIFEHEQRHIAMDEALVRRYASVFPAVLREALGSMGAVRASSPEQAQEIFRARVRSYMDALGLSLSQVRRKFQKTIDTQEEYARLTALLKACPDSPL